MHRAWGVLRGGCALVPWDGVIDSFEVVPGGKV